MGAACVMMSMANFMPGAHWLIILRLRKRQSRVFSVLRPAERPDSSLPSSALLRNVKSKCSAR